MSAPAIPSEYLHSLELTGLNLEVYAEPKLATQAETLLPLLEKAWTSFLQVAQDEQIFQSLGLSPPQQTLEIELYWVNNPTMQMLNREYRNKDSATDVLTFTLFADHPDPTAWKTLPVIQLGSIFIGVEWAEAELLKTSGKVLQAYALERYLLERFVHGLLHLLGIHHDTMDQFHRVVRIQQFVLNIVFKESTV